MAGYYRTQYEEALLFFDSIIRYEQPIFRLIDADWMFINKHQTNIYRIPLKEDLMKVDNALPAVNIHYRNEDRKIYEGNYEYKHLPLSLKMLDDPNREAFLPWLYSECDIYRKPNQPNPTWCLGYGADSWDSF